MNRLQTQKFKDIGCLEKASKSELLVSLGTLEVQKVHKEYNRRLELDISNKDQRGWIRAIIKKSFTSPMRIEIYSHASIKHERREKFLLHKGTLPRVTTGKGFSPTIVERVLRKAKEHKYCKKTKEADKQIAEALTENELERSLSTEGLQYLTQEEYKRAREEHDERLLKTLKELKREEAEEGNLSPGRRRWFNQEIGRARGDQ